MTDDKHDALERLRSDFDRGAIFFPSNDDDAIKRLQRTVQSELDRAAFATTADPALAPRFSIDGLAETLDEIAKLPRLPRLEHITVREDCLDELLALHDLTALLVGVPLLTSKTLGPRWIMQWSAETWICQSDGTIYKIPRVDVRESLNPIIAFEPPPSVRFEMSLAPRFAFGFVAKQVAHDLTRLIIGIDFGYEPPRYVRPPKRERASKGWRKHVRRQKAAERRTARFAR